MPLVTIVSLLPIVKAEPTPSFTFSAAGDFEGITPGSRGQTVANAIAARNPNFHIVLGDFGYLAQNPTNWRSSFKAIYPGNPGNGGSLVLITGDHDTSSDGAITYTDQSTGLRSDTLTSTTAGSPAEGFLDDTPGYPGYVSRCGPPAGINWVGSGVSYGGGTCQVLSDLTSPSCYGREYYFDYPSSNPIMRFIFIIGGIGGSWVNYASGTTHYNWLSDRIDEAKNAGLWTAVVNHRNCVSDGSIGACQSTFDPFKLAVTKKVDLWLNGNDHNYQRSKQLSSPPEDPCIGSGTTFTSCHKADEGDGQLAPYVRGAGTVVNVIGTGGRAGAGICNPSPGPCPRAGYFVKLCGANGEIASEPKTLGCKSDYGFSFFTVTTTSITADWVTATCSSQPCTFNDHYVIKQLNPATEFSVSSNITRVSRGTVGGPGTYSSVGTVNANSFGGFSGTVSLSPVSVSGGPTGTCPGPSCPTATLDTMSLTLTAGNTAHAILKFSNTLNAPCSNPDDQNVVGIARYTVTVTASFGSTQHNYVILVYIYGRGDIVKDGTVNILDVATAARQWQFDSSRPDFDPNLDLTNDGRIDILDIATIAFYYPGTGC